MHLVKSFYSVIKSKNAKLIRFYQPLLKTKLSPSIPVYHFSHGDSESDETEKIVEEICQGNPELEKKLRVLMLEVEVMRQDGRVAPDHMNTGHWKSLLELTSKRQRSQYLLYLFKREKSKENKKERQFAKNKDFLDGKLEGEPKQYPDDLTYGLSDQSLFLRIREASLNKFYNYKALQAILYGNKMVLDCSYEEKMVKREILNTAKQITLSFGDNRVHKEPFNMYLCNLNPQGVLMEHLRKHIPNIDEPWFPFNLHSESYLDLFPKNKLVYLTPHCREELTEFDPDAIYIVGALVDLVNQEPLSLAKAKRENIKMAKLPLERYNDWAPGAKKNLNVNHMVPIMLDLALTGDWEFALKHIPRRKLMETKIMAFQKKVKNKSLQDDLRAFENIPQYKKELKKFKSLKPSKIKISFDDDSYL